MDSAITPAAYRDPPPFEIEAHGHAFSFYPGGADRFDALVRLIEDARESLRVCFYIFADDKAGRAVLGALVAAARRGVRVALIVDSFGSGGTPGAAFAALREAGGEFCAFSPRWSVRYLVRNHQKMVIADEARAMIGGFNVADDYFAPPQTGGWHDLALTLQGPAVLPLARWFDRLHAWTADPHAQWRAIRRLIRGWDPGKGPLQWLVGGPTRGISPWARAVSRDLVHGRKLDMIMAYFSPAARLLGRIGRIARKGETRLVLAATSDNGATIGASRLLYGPLLKRGAAIYEFAPTKLHTKLIVLDDAVYVGSANFDMRSLYINVELMLRIEDAALADAMRRYLAAHLPYCDPITPAVHRRQLTVWNRLRWSLSWLLVSVIDYTVSRRLNLGL